MKNKRKTRTKKDEKIEFLEENLYNNALALHEGPVKRKNWSIHDLKHISPLTESQREMMESYIQGNNVVATGSAGTGKSYVALYLALNDLLNKESQKEKIILVRSTVQSRDMGFLPGSMEEKMEPFEMPYIDIVNDLLKFKNAYTSFKESGMLKFVSTSFVRGLSWNNAIVVIDEMQNMTAMEINSVMTRIGKNTSLITCGDISQNDLIYKKNDVSGYAEALDILKNIKTVDVVNFTENDIVRSDFTKQWIIAKQSI